MTPHVLVRKTTIKVTIKEVFDFFSKAENLNHLTPPEVNFKFITQLPIEMKKGAVIDYKIKINGITFNWRTEITKWEPPFYFEDTQTKGPYKLWIHEHKFAELNGNTEMTDTVNYLSPGGIFEFIPHNLIVKKKVESIFDYRKKVLSEIFS